MANGEVKKIDEAAGKITLKHGPIKNLDMQDESMTMVFPCPGSRDAEDRQSR